MLRCAELGLATDEVLDSMTMGMVYDMMIEQSNDHEKYPFQPSQKDFEYFSLRDN